MKILDGLDVINDVFDHSDDKKSKVCACYSGNCQSSEDYMNGYLAGVSDGTPFES